MKLTIHCQLYNCHIFVYHPYFVFNRDNLARLESEAQKAHRDREERPVIWADLDLLASGLMSYFTYT